MAPAVFFLLLAIWMQELSLIGIRIAPLIGIGLLLATASEVRRYRRITHAPPATEELRAAAGRLTREVHTVRSRATAHGHV